jgi:hypothetical protein
MADLLYKLSNHVWVGGLRDKSEREDQVMRGAGVLHRHYWRFPGADPADPA